LTQINEVLGHLEYSSEKRASLSRKVAFAGSEAAQKEQRFLMLANPVRPQVESDRNRAQGRCRASIFAQYCRAAY
jgi:hypothetical protein